MLADDKIIDNVDGPYPILSIIIILFTFCVLKYIDDRRK